jgi:peroxiredoxin (alkyl hydroperoxide reductase subunit C)
MNTEATNNQPFPLIGMALPDLEMKAYHEDKEITVRLSDYKGKWLALMFYPADFTFICPTELEEAAELYPKFLELGGDLMSVSTDTVYTHKAWHDQSPAIKKIQFPMLADPAAKLSRLLGCYLEDEGLALRASFVINPNGIIVAYEVHHNDIGRSGEELLRKVQAAQYVHEHGGEVCPAKWRPGAKTLHPGMDLVGKI